ncbi:MAG: vWA domain-containing protein, partial [Planctomycetota bacterium]
MSTPRTDGKFCTGRNARLIRTLSHSKGSQDNPTFFGGRRKRSSGVALLALSVSIAVHVLILAAFGVVRFSGSESQTIRQAKPTGQIIQSQKQIHIPVVIGKPKVIRARTREARSIQPLIERTAELLGTGTDAPRCDLSSAASSFSALELGSESVAFMAETEFFGVVTTGRKVCYVVDCSGSMKGVFGRVRRELVESIRRLGQDQYFGIIFFGGDRLGEFSGGRLVRASSKSKSLACDFIDSVRPAGRTNAFTALKRATELRDSGGQGASVVYFLSDGFDLSDDLGDSFAYRARDMMSRLPGDVRIYTIGFWCRKDDRRMLEEIAKQSGGEFVSVDSSVGTDDTFLIFGRYDQDRIFALVGILAVVLAIIFAVKQPGTDGQAFGEQTLFSQFVVSGGPVVWFVLLPMSLATVYLAVEHFLSLSRKRLLSEDVPARIVEHIRRFGTARLEADFAETEDLVGDAVVRAVSCGK